MSNEPKACKVCIDIQRELVKETNKREKRKLEKEQHDAEMIVLAIKEAAVKKDMQDQSVAQQETLLRRQKGMTRWLFLIKELEISYLGEESKRRDESIKKDLENKMAKLSLQHTKKLDELSKVKKSKVADDMTVKKSKVKTFDVSSRVPQDDSSSHTSSSGSSSEEEGSDVSDGNSSDSSDSDVDSSSVSSKDIKM